MALISLSFTQLIAFTLLLELNGLISLPAFTSVPNFTFSQPANLSVGFSHELPLISERRQQDSARVPEIAKAVTVRVLSPEKVGSGVIVAHQGQTYIVVTCDHVVAGNRSGFYTILTADGSKHTAQRLRSAEFGDADLALVQFTSNKSYRIVQLGEFNSLAVGDSVYASGFPNWHWLNSDAIEDTRDWGLKAYRLTTGKVGMLAKRTLPRGYQLGYTNDIEDGMSGGPVFNTQGQLIGINGRLKYPPQGIDAYTFEDGTVPSDQLFQQMEALSWAVPVSIFQQKIRP